MKSALLVIDVQNGVCKSDQVIFNYEDLIAQINNRINYYRQYEVIMQHHASSTFDNKYMTAKDTVNFFESIWNNNFLHFI